MRAPKTYVELVFFKGDTNQDGAIFRMNEMKVLMKAARELNGLQYQEDQASYALFGSYDKMHEGKEMAKAFRSKVLSRVDLCGFLSAAELETKVQTLVKLAQEQKLTCGLDLINIRASDLIMDGVKSIKEWSV